MDANVYDRPVTRYRKPAWFHCFPSKWSNRGQTMTKRAGTTTCRNENPRPSLIDIIATQKDHSQTRPAAVNRIPIIVGGWPALFICDLLPLYRFDFLYTKLRLIIFACVWPARVCMTYICTPDLCICSYNTMLTHRNNNDGNIIHPKTNTLLTITPSQRNTIRRKWRINKKESLIVPEGSRNLHLPVNTRRSFHTIPVQSALYISINELLCYTRWL